MQHGGVGPMQVEGTQQPIRMDNNLPPPLAIHFNKFVPEDIPYAKKRQS